MILLPLTGFTVLWGLLMAGVALLSDGAWLEEMVIVTSIVALIAVVVNLVQMYQPVSQQ
jgi:hypothetical protein